MYISFLGRWGLKSIPVGLPLRVAQTTMSEITLCDDCGNRIGEMDIPHPMLEITVRNGIDHDIEGDYCVHCARDIAEVVRQVVNDE